MVFCYLFICGGQRLVVMVNEFGSVGFDGDLICSCGFCFEEEVDGCLVELNNGCFCCMVQDDFLLMMEMLFEWVDCLDGIVVEISGFVLLWFLFQVLDWLVICSCVYVNGVVMLVDGEVLVVGSLVVDVEVLEW